ncbi:MAG: ZIP family metal transporter [Verrucomicrobia bacterium]|nr:ZIP family metal transporter [Verrucomicrobiota bacterium]
MDTLLAPSHMLFIYCVAVFLIALMGGWFILALRLNHTRLQIALSAVAGLMLGIGLLNFIPHAIHQNHSPAGTMRWVLCGFLLMFFLQRLFLYHHHHSLESDYAPKPQATDSSIKDHPQDTPSLPHSHAAAHKGISWLGTAVGLSLHSLVDGIVLATAATFTVHPTQSIWTGLGVAMAVILHKPFGAAAISTLMTAEGCSRSLQQIVNLLFALVTPLAALLFYMGIASIAQTHPVFQGNALAFCAGTFLCIACADLLPELQFHTHDRLKLTLSLLVGLCVAFLVGYFGHPKDAAHESQEHMHEHTLIQKSLTPSQCSVLTQNS